ncbi:MAG: GUN4 domain-containing protein, partial [Cyanobacteria bacterium J06626_18]
MTQESLHGTELHRAESVETASVILKILKDDWSLDDLEEAVRGFWDSVIQLDLTATATQLSSIDCRRLDHRTLQITLREPEQILTLMKGISRHLQENPVQIQLVTVLGQAQLQMQTQEASEILGLLPTLETLLPPQQIFQARAATYAMRGGELSPVEQANLELLRYRLDLSTEDADGIIARALGPYRDREEKLQKYREVLSAEINRQSPLSETTWAELRRLYQALGLANEDVIPVNDEYVARVQAEVTHLQMQEEATRLQEETLLQEEQIQREIAEQQNNTERYRQEFQQAIANALFPSEFDRGKLEKARQLWDLDTETVRAIEREVTDERYGPIESGCGLDYSRLRQLLWLNQWENADKETERLILTALSRDMQPLESDAIMKLNCIDMQTIDALWSRYSRRNFGFVAQHNAYVQNDRRADDFLKAVGWQGAAGIGNLLPNRKPYRKLRFALDAEAGHLPTWRWGTDALEEAYIVEEKTVDTFFLHLEKCMPALPSGSVG